MLARTHAQTSRLALPSRRARFLRRGHPRCVRSPRHGRRKLRAPTKGVTIVATIGRASSEAAADGRGRCEI